MVPCRGFLVLPPGAGGLMELMGALTNLGPSKYLDGHMHAILTEHTNTC